MTQPSAFRNRLDLRAIELLLLTVLLIPLGAQAQDIKPDFADYPFQTGSSLNVSGINYGLLKQQDAMKRLKEIEGSMATR